MRGILFIFVDLDVENFFYPFVINYENVNSPSLTKTQD